MNAQNHLPNGAGAGTVTRASRAKSSLDGADWHEAFQRFLTIEHELEESRERYAAFFDSAPVGHATLDGNGCIHTINLTGAKILGHPREHLKSRPLLPLVAKKERRKFLNTLRALRRQPDTMTCELHFQRPDGSQSLLQLVCKSTPTDRRRPDFIHAMLLDLTIQRRIEVELNQSRAVLASIVASVMDAIITVDADQKIVHANAAAETMFHYNASEMTGQPLSLLLPDQLRQLLAGQVSRFAQIGAGNRIGVLGELQGRRADGGEFPIEASISRVIVDDQKLLTIILRDISPRKQLEEMERLGKEMLEHRVRERTAQLSAANEALQREIAERRRLQHHLLEVSKREQLRIGRDLHDGIGQQLTGIMLLADTLQGKLNGKSEQADVRRLVSLLSQAREQTRQLAHGLHPVPPSAHGLMLALNQFAQSISQLHRVDCRLRCPKPVLLPDNTAATHLFRIAQEAVHNAIRHGHSKRIMLSLAARKGAISLRIQDNGQGFQLPSSPEPERRAPSRPVSVHGPDARPFLEVEASHEPASERGICAASVSPRRQTLKRPEGRAPVHGLPRRPFAPKRSEGGSAAKAGLGLQIMRARCEAIGALLKIRPVRPRGTLVECRLPASPPAINQLNLL